MDKILIVEDSREVSEVLNFYLSQTGKYEVHEVQSAEDAYARLRATRFDAVLLDIMLPGIDGISFCQQMHKELYCPVIFISCLDDEETIVRALNAGGDDYLVKPFSYAVLVARLEANIRRSRMLRPSEAPLCAGDLVLDPTTRTVRKGEAEVSLSMIEYELLYYMMRRPGEFMAFDSIYEAVWNGPSCGDLRTLFTHVANLRKKLEDNPQKPTHIVTKQRSGYMFF